MAKSKNAAKTGPGLLATVDAADFAKRLGFVTGALPRRNNIPILDCVRVCAANGEVTLAVTNLDQQSETAVPAEVKGEGAFCVAAARLSETVSRFKGELLLDMTGGSLKLAAGRCRADLPVLPAEDFNDLRGPEGGNSFEVASGVLLSGFGSVMHCASKEEARYYLRGVYVEPRMGSMIFTATDGHRLATLKVTSGISDDVRFEPMIVPREPLRDYMKFLERADGPVLVTIDDNRLQMSAVGETHITKLIDGQFPDYERVIPKGPFTRIALPVADLRAAVVAAMTAALGKSRAVRFEPHEGRLVCSSRTDDQYCEAEVEALDIEPGEPFGLNGAYVTDALDILRAADVELNLSGPNSQILISTGDELRQVIMQLRV